MLDERYCVSVSFFFMMAGGGGGDNANCHRYYLFHFYAWDLCVQKHKIYRFFPAIDLCVSQPTNENWRISFAQSK